MKTFLTRILMGIGLLVFIGACSSGAFIKSETGKQKIRLDKAIEEGAMYCASYESAMAETELAYTEALLSAGYDRAAEDSYAEALKLTDFAVTNASRCMAADSDNDGVKDMVDECPSVPGTPALKGCPPPEEEVREIIVYAAQCSANQTQPGRTPCGLNQRGKIDQECVNGQWKDTQNCTDPDECKDGEENAVSCGEDGKGAQPQKCEKGKWNHAGACKPFDTDKDTIPDAEDKCPDVPGVKEEQGCPKKYKLIIVSAKQIELKQTVYFKTGKALLNSKSHAMLKEVADAIISTPGIAKVIIEGHTDNVGARERNITLSRQRAEAVKAYLVSQGAPASKLEAVGFGPDQPIASNKTAPGRAKNRRVDFKIEQ